MRVNAPLSNPLPINTATLKPIALSWLKYTLIFGGTVLLIAWPFLLTAPQWLLTSFHSMSNRSTWETLWAVLEGFYGFGEVGGDRLNPAERNFAVHNQGWLPWPLITLGFAALYLFIFFKQADYRRPQSVVALFGLILTLFLLYAKGYSPQFIALILPFIILLLPNFTGLAYAFLLEVLNLLEQPVFFIILPNEQWLLAGVVSLRFLAFVLLSVEFARMIWPNFLGRPRLMPVLRSSLVGLSLLGLIAFIPLGWQGYREGQLEYSPQRAAIEFLQSQTIPPESTLIFTEQKRYQAMHPYLYGQYTLKLAGGDVLYSGAPSPSEVVNGASTVWLLPSGEQGDYVKQSLAELGQPQVSYTLAGFGPFSLYQVNGSVGPPQPLAQTDEGIALVGYTVQKEADGLKLTLYWHSQGTPPSSYTVFTQILDAQGQFVAGHDALPAKGQNPTETWTPTELIPDTHLIPLPADLAFGDYRLVVGMYGPAGQRLNFIGPNGESFVNQAILLETINLQGK